MGEDKCAEMGSLKDEKEIYRLLEFISYTAQYTLTSSSLVLHGSSLMTFWGGLFFFLNYYIIFISHFVFLFCISLLIDVMNQKEIAGGGVTRAHAQAEEGARASYFFNSPRV